MLTREQYNERFQRELERLNPAQRRAVEQTEGPVLVIAGPGTGKTHILGARIGRILLETDASAGNILCLTFTDAGVRAMRDRLLHFIGPEAHRVHIYTFHSFCNSIIQDNMELFGRQDLEPISDLERVELTRELIDDLPPDHPLRRNTSDRYFYEKHLITLFQQMKAETWSVDQVQEAIRAYLQDLPNRKEYVYQRKYKQYQKGDLKDSLYQEEVDRMTLLEAAVHLFPAYEERKYRARRYDYEDMIRWVLDAFAEHEALLRNYQERYLYLLIDEFQDTNGAQNQLVRYLTQYWEIPNIFIVGDDDQSIYEFQGARLKNLTDFYDIYQPNLEVVVLTDNYRSTQVLLNQAARLIDQNELRILRKLPIDGAEKNLLAAHPDRQGIHPLPSIVEYPNPQHELADIVRQIEAWRKEGVLLNEIAILYARHRQAEPLIQLLEQRKIPYQTKRRINVLDLPEIVQYRTLLEWFDRELHSPGTADYHLFRLLHFDFWQIHLPDLMVISLHLSRTPNDQRPTWRQLIADDAFLRKLHLKDPQALLGASALLEELLVDAANRSLPEFAERLLNRTGMLDRALATVDPTGHIEILSTFFNLMRKEARRTPRMTIADLLATLDRMEANRIGLNLERTIDTHRGVQLITAHSAKGLEFDRVFILDAVQDAWEPRQRRARYQFRLPDTLTLSGEEDALEARRRLFYVAMTRARHWLQLSYGRQNEDGKERQRAIFVDELLIPDELEIEERSVDAEFMVDTQQELLKERPNPLIAPHHGAAVSRVLEDFTLSISALNSYLYCPLAFYFEYVLRVPRLLSESAAYGTAAHVALHRLFYQMTKSKPRHFGSQKAFIGFFTEELEKLRYQLSPEAMDRLRERGAYRLGQYYQQKLGTWNRKVVLEYTIRQVEVDGVPLTGTIDKLEFLKQQVVRIVDYKTGKHRKDKLRRPTEKNPQGGSYWRQLSFYKVLYDTFDTQGHRCHSATIAYLDPDARGSFPEETLEFNITDTQQVRQLIQDTWERIQQHQFYEGCGEENCQWCQFVREQVRPHSFQNPILEETDDV